MESSALIQILRTLPATTLRSLDKFVHSPYHVTHEGVVDLYNYFRGVLPEQAGVLLHKAHIAKSLGVEPVRLQHLQSYLLSSIEDFLAQEAWKEHDTDRYLLTVEQLRKLRLNEASAAMLRYARKRLENHPQRGSSYHRAQHSLHLEAYALSMQQGRARIFNLQELSDAQDVAFICEKLRTGCMLLSHQAVRQQPYDKGLLEHVLAFLEGHPYLEIPAVAVYYHGYYAQQGADDSAAHFRQLKEQLAAHHALLSLAELHDLYLMAINYCIRCINRGEESYLVDVFELYQSGLVTGALMESGVLSRWTYNNVALTALSLREFEWTWRFLHEYASFLQSDHREAAFNFNLARYYYETGDYKAAMQHFLHMEYDDVLQNLVAKIILCKIYYELEEFDALENQLDSIQIYLRRKKVLGYHKENYLAFSRFMRKMLHLRHNDAAAKNALRLLITSAPILTEKEWFLKQLQ